jgi:hypothetical protein
MAASKVSANEEPTTVVDAIVRDACDAQRDNGLIPTPIDNRQFIQPIVERLDRKPKIVDSPQAAPRADASRREFERRGGKDFGSMQVRRTEGADIIAPAKARDHGAQIIAARLRLLRSKPEWMARLKTINPLASNGVLGPEKQKEAMQALWGIIEDSCRVFGRLGAETPRPMYFTGAGK